MVIKHSTLFAFLILLFNGCVSACMYAAPTFVDDWYILAFMISFFGFLYLVYIKRQNILFLSRTLFIGLLGYYPIFIKCINPYGFYSSLSIETQSFSLALKLYMLTNIAIIANEIGLLLGANGKLQASVKDVLVDEKNYDYLRFLFWFSTLLILCIGTHAGFFLAPSLFTASYASADVVGESFLHLGNLNSIALMSLFLMLLISSIIAIPFGKKSFVFCILYYLIWCLFLHGARMDVINGFLGLYVVYKMKHRQAPRISPKIFILSIILVLLFEYWGALRTTGTLLEADFSGAVANTLNLTKGDTQVYHFGTVSPISTTFSHVVYLVDNEKLSLQLGKSYWEYILRSPPEILYPDRPKDYAWMFADYDLAAVGGMYELGEAYMNFGVFGCLLIPGVISFLIARTYRNAFYRQTLWHYYLMFSFTATWLRGNWYQTFAFYKTFLTAIILYFISKLIYAYFFKPFIRKKIGYPQVL